jgi:1-acyl-sn-glycerol-3-phosphate acyltransferase
MPERAEFALCDIHGVVRSFPTLQSTPLPVFTIPHKPLPSRDEVEDALSALAAKARTSVRPNDLHARDTAFIGRILPLFGALYDHYFRCETELVAELPKGRFLAVANHNGMTGTPDMFCHMVAFWRLYGPERRSYGLMHDVPFKFPIAGSWLNASGALRATPDNARRALEADAAVLVFPGGDLDACKPFSKRYSIEFARRRGFLRTAIREGVPVVPIVSVGAHSSLYIWSDGRRLAEILRLPKIARSNVAPIGFALPWGIIVGVPYPHIPPPVKIHTRILPAIDLGLPPSAAEDPEAVEGAFERVMGPMRAAMEELKKAGRHGLFPWW